MTNREWLESLADAELAQELVNPMCETFCKHDGEAACMHGYACEDRALLWLQQERGKSDNVVVFENPAAADLTGKRAEKEGPEGRGANVAKDDFISRSALFKSWDGLSDEIKEPDLLVDEMIKRTQDAPTVNAEPVTCSRWLKHAGAQNTTYWTCLNCDTLGSPRWKRCPVCEAKMEVQHDG